MASQVSWKSTQVRGATEVKLYFIRLMTFCCLVSILLGVSSLRAQEVTASIYGTVRDPSGAAVAGATVEAIQVSTNTTRSTTTDSAGAYQIPRLLELTP